jgi:DNA-binding winged helix-turn-helix (wHTH) protein
VTSDGRELSKDELMELVWQDQIVEENNLAVHIYNLRKILGERKDEHRYIITIPGVGYRFVADVNETTNEPEQVFIERHTISRIVVEEKSDKDESIDAVKRLNSEVVYSTNEIEAAKPIANVSFFRNRFFILLVLVGFLLAAGFGGYLLYRNRSQASDENIRKPNQQMTITRITEGRTLGAPTISPDGKFIAYVENTFTGAGTLFVQQIDTNTVREILEPAERTFGCTEFSPDGRKIDRSDLPSPSKSAGLRTVAMPEAWLTVKV